MENYPPSQHAAPAVAVPHSSERFGNIPQPSEDFRSVPQTSEPFRTVPQHSEPFRSIPNPSEQFRTERKQSHAITVRDAARMFEDAGVARTERSIVNWCRRDATGLSRLDAYYDPNERRYYITEESIERTISEEKAKALRSVPNPAEAVPKRSDAPQGPTSNGGNEARSPSDASAVTKELLDLRILNAGKDMVIKQLREERDNWIHQLIDGSKKIGELEARVLQLEGPSERKLRVRESLPKDSEESQTFGI